MQRLLDAFDGIRLQDVEQHLRSSAELDPDGNATLRMSSFLVAEDIPMEVWNRFARRDSLPMGLRLQHLLWSENAVWIVECTTSQQHGETTMQIYAEIAFACQRNIANSGDGLIAAPGQPAQSPDLQFKPLRHLPGVVVPNNLTFPPAEWTTVIVEVLYNQSWATVHPKVNVYRQRPGVEYILCVRLSQQLRGWSYELYDVRNGVPAPPAFANRIWFDARRVNQNAPHIFHVVLESWRVLGFPQHAQLPAGVPPTLDLDMVALAHHVRSVFAP